MYCSNKTGLNEESLFKLINKRRVMHLFPDLQDKTTTTGWSKAWSKSIRHRIESLAEIDQLQRNG